MKTAAQLTAGELAIYRETAKRRTIERSARLVQRRDHAMSLAREAAAMLRTKFGATNVYLFGSLAQPGAFTEVSDIDLAVEGLRSRDYFRALAAVMSLDRRFRIDLVDLADCVPSLAGVVTEEGKAL